MSTPINGGKGERATGIKKRGIRKHKKGNTERVSANVLPATNRLVIEVVSNFGIIDFERYQNGKS
jgi:hypothetical protein